MSALFIHETQHTTTNITLLVPRYLQQNVLSHLDGLERVPGLETLNISRNALSSLDGLQHCCALTTLLCSQNELTGHDSLSALTQCRALSTVDLQDNNLDANVVSSLQRVPPQSQALNMPVLALGWSPITIHALGGTASEAQKGATLMRQRLHALSQLYCVPPGLRLGGVCRSSTVLGTCRPWDACI